MLRNKRNEDARINEREGEASAVGNAERERDTGRTDDGLENRCATIDRQLRLAELSYSFVPRRRLGDSIVERARLARISGFERGFSCPRVTRRLARGR